MPTKTIGDKELEYTKPMEFKPAKRPEEAIQGNVIRFMYSPSSDPSAYWLQGTLNSRIDNLKLQKNLDGGRIVSKLTRLASSNIGEIRNLCPQQSQLI